MEIKPIKTEEEYNKALSRMDELFDGTPLSKEFDEAKLLMAIIGIYEQKHHKIDAPDPI
jgi:HTH-type transcriptional regulator/antitoxin HigA